MLTTKFKPRSTSTSPSRHIIPPPPAISNAFKDQRDAALRERGLLPPLPNKDLSTQEMEQDYFIPVVSSFEEPEKPDEANPSAADLIKKEWVSKNHNGERERMNSFKFGGGVSESFVADLLTPTAANQGPANVDPVSPPPIEALPLVPTPESANLPPSSDRTPLGVDVSAEVQAFMFPLPPSPSPSPSSTKGGFSLPPASPTIPPSLLSIPDTPYSLHTTIGPGSGTNTPRPLDTQRDTTPIPLPVPPSPPAISLTPPTDFVRPPFKEGKKSVDDSIISAFHSRTDSFAQLEESISSSATVPSLDASNSTATTDSVASSNLNADAAAATTKTSAPIPKGKLGGLTVRTNDAPVIPVIVESPIVDGFSNELEVVVEEPLSILMDETDKEADDNDEKPAMTSLLTPPQSPQSSAAGAPGVPRPRKKRGLTDPTSVGDKRKSSYLNPFKRGATLDNNSANGDELKPPQSPTTNRRLSVATSFSSIRRSVAGTLSSKKGPVSPSGDGKRRRFDASHLPPSPTLPSSLRSASPGLRGAPPPVRTRTAVAPVLYSRGSILLETSNIEDEETRHRTEMAFLG